ncbi:MAG: hypothetical protein GXO26_02220 [Crenarchaeota archaeon]|nr:hypothetical protein [Thermoproteota archaeon]
MRVKIRRISTRYWLPIGPERTLLKLRKILRSNVNNRTIVILSEKALLISCGYIYDEGLINVNKFSKFMVRLYRDIWCKIFRRLLKDFVYDSICNVRVDDIVRHALFCSRTCKGHILSLLKPVSTCGVDASGLPYYYVTNPGVDYRNIIDELYKRLRVRSIIVADSDTSLIIKKLNIVLTSRPVFLNFCINLGVITYILSRLRSRLFIKCPTMTYSVGDPTLCSYRGFLLLKKVERYRRACYGRSVTEMMRFLLSSDYTSVTWTQLSLSRPHYPIILVDFLN